MMEQPENKEQYYLDKIAKLEDLIRHQEYSNKILHENNNRLAGRLLAYDKVISSGFISNPKAIFDDAFLLADFRNEITAYVNGQDFENLIASDITKVCRIRVEILPK